MKVLFLDIDGVLNTHISLIFHGMLHPRTKNVKNKLD